MSKSLFFFLQVLDRVKKETDFQTLGKKKMRATVFFFMFKYFSYNHQETDFASFGYNHQETDFANLKEKLERFVFSLIQIHKYQQSKEPEFVFNFLHSLTKLFSFLFLPQLNPPWPSELGRDTGCGLDWHLPELEEQEASLFHAFSFFDCSIPTNAATNPGIATVI